MLYYIARRVSSTDCYIAGVRLLTARVRDVGIMTRGSCVCVILVHAERICSTPRNGPVTKKEFMFDTPPPKKGIKCDKSVCFTAASFQNTSLFDRVTKRVVSIIRSHRVLCFPRQSRVLACRSSVRRPSPCDPGKNQKW